MTAKGGHNPGDSASNEPASCRFSNAAVKKRHLARGDTSNVRETFDETRKE